MRTLKIMTTILICTIYSNSFGYSSNKILPQFPHLENIHPFDLFSDERGRIYNYKNDDIPAKLYDFIIRELNQSVLEEYTWGLDYNVYDYDYDYDYDYNYEKSDYSKKHNVYLEFDVDKDVKTVFIYIPSRTD